MTAPVWVVASAHTAERWADAIDASGFPAVALPWSEIACVDARRALAGALAAGTPDLLLLTSANAVRCLPEGVPFDLPAACVGQATADAALAAGLAVGHVGSGTGVELVETLIAGGAPARVLFLRGREVRPEGAARLREAGTDVQDVVVYEATVRPDLQHDVADAPEPAAFAVGSPRGAEALASALVAAGRGGLRGLPTAAIGRTTAERLRSLGFDPVLEASVPGVPGLIAALRRGL